MDLPDARQVFAMSQASYPRNRWILRTAAAATLGLTLAGFGNAQQAKDGEADWIDQIRRTEQIALQKMEQDVRSALVDADKLAARAPEKAIDRLRVTLDNLEEDAFLPKDRRQAAVRSLQARIKTLEAGMAQGTAQSEGKAKPRSNANERREEEERAAEQIKSVKARLAGILAAQDEGKLADAAKDAADFAQGQPANTAAQASQQMAATADKAAAISKNKALSAQGIYNANLDMSKSSTLPRGDLDFPKDWAEKTRRRSDTAQLTTKERALLRALNSPISVSFKNTRIEAAIEYLQTATGQTILLDQSSLKEVDATYDSPVSMNAKGVALRTVLRKILADVGLTYIVQNETIQVTTVQRAKATLVTKRYYIGDLLASMSPSTLTQPTGLPIQQAPFVRPFIAATGLTGLAYGGTMPAIVPGAAEAAALQNQAQTAAVLKQLIDMIRNSVDASSWDTNGGPGSIAYHAPSMSLVIKQTAEMHALLGTSLLK
jgi:hypothetical protein